MSFTEEDLKSTKEYSRTNPYAIDVCPKLDELIARLEAAELICKSVEENAPPKFHLMPLVKEWRKSMGQK